MKMQINKFQGKFLQILDKTLGVFILEFNGM